MAAASVIYDRLKEERDRVRAANVASRDLVVVKEGAVTLYMKDRYPHMKRKTLDGSVRDDQAYIRGTKAGQSAELRRGVEGGSGPGTNKLT